MLDKAKPAAQVKGEWAIERTVQLGKRLTVKLTHGPGGYTAEWSQRPRRLNSRQWRLYREARNALCAEVAARFGCSALIIEPTTADENGPAIVLVADARS